MNNEDFLAEKEKRIQLYIERASRECDLFSGEPIKKEVKLNKEEISWLKSIGLK